MFGLELSVIGVLLAVVTGIGSFLLGRYLRKRGADKRRERERAVREALDSRQVRRARARRQAK